MLIVTIYQAGFNNLIDVKFASELKNIIWIYPYTDVCTLGTFQGSVRKIHGHITQVGFGPMTFAILEQMTYN